MKHKRSARLVGAMMAISLAALGLVTTPALPARADNDLGDDLAFQVKACLNGYTLTLPQQGFLSGSPYVYLWATATVTSMTLPGTKVTAKAWSYYADSQVGYWTTPQIAWGGNVTFTVQQTGYYTVSNTTTSTKMYSFAITQNFSIQNCTVLYPWEVVPKPIGPINLQHGSLISQLTPGLDPQGNPDLQVWCVDPAGKGFFGGAVTGADITAAPALPGSKTLVRRIDACLAPVAFYVAPDGEYQVDIGPDGEGKTYITNFTGLPPTNIYFDGNAPGGGDHGSKPGCTPTPMGTCH